METAVACMNGRYYSRSQNRWKRRYNVQLSESVYHEHMPRSIKKVLQKRVRASQAVLGSNLQNVLVQNTLKTNIVISIRVNKSIFYLFMIYKNSEKIEAVDLIKLFENV